MNIRGPTGEREATSPPIVLLPVTFASEFLLASTLQPLLLYLSLPTSNSSNCRYVQMFINTIYYHNHEDDPHVTMIVSCPIRKACWTVQAPYTQVPFARQSRHPEASHKLIACLGRFIHAVTPSHLRPNHRPRKCPSPVFLTHLPDAGCNSAPDLIRPRHHHTFFLCYHTLRPCITSYFMTVAELCVALQLSTPGFASEPRARRNQSGGNGRARL